MVACQKTLFELIESKQDKWYALLDDIWKHPETGYREWRTSALLQKEMEAMGYSPVLFGDIPGFYCDLDTGRPGPTIAVMGEMDALICAGHPEADPATGAVHACGHHAQSVALLAAADALRHPDVLGTLCGVIRLIAVPAEEGVEPEYRAKLRKEGTIRYFNGKAELIRRRIINENMAAGIMVHVSELTKKFLNIRGHDGLIAKSVVFHGKATHAGAAPFRGINAQYAASQALSAINALRETFKDEDHIRVHPLLNFPDGSVNIIPDEVRLDAYVRGATLEAIAEANERVNRAIAGAALSLGATATLEDRNGSLPVYNDPGLTALALDWMREMCGEDEVIDSPSWGAGCTDMGDVSHLIPALHPYIKGGGGIAHGVTYYIDSREDAVLLSAKYMAGLACALLENGAEKAISIKAGYKPSFDSCEALCRHLDRGDRQLEMVSYDGEGQAHVSW